jgi:AmmeMemoRadiSam system protein A
MSLIKEHSQTLLQVAKDSIQHGLDKGRALKVVPFDYAEELRNEMATFVTLEIHKNLRGCIGTLVAVRPLVSDVAYHAYAAAFSDPRFPGLRRDEFPLLDIHISILSKPERIDFDSEEHLIQQMRPGVDGLIMSDGLHKGTFLPAVWESLSDPRDFLSHLKQKAGLPLDYWSDSIEVERYTTEYIQ